MQSDEGVEHEFGLSQETSQLLCDLLIQSDEDITYQQFDNGDFHDGDVPAPVFSNPFFELPCAEFPDPFLPTTPSNAPILDMRLLDASSQGWNPTGTKLAADYPANVDPGAIGFFNSVDLNPDWNGANISLDLGEIGLLPNDPTGVLGLPVQLTPLDDLQNIAIQNTEPCLDLQEAGRSDARHAQRYLSEPSTGATTELSQMTVAPRPLKPILPKPHLEGGSQNRPELTSGRRFQKRKRSTSPQTKRDIAHIGADEDSLIVFAICRPAQTDNEERKKPGRQRSKRTCLRCQEQHLKCSDELPCKCCLNLWQSRQSSRNLAWRYCIDTDIRALSPLNSSLLPAVHRIPLNDSFKWLCTRPKLILKLMDHNGRNWNIDVGRHNSLHCRKHLFLRAIWECLKLHLHFQGAGLELHNIRHNIRSVTEASCRNVLHVVLWKKITGLEIETVLVIQDFLRSIATPLRDLGVAPAGEGNEAVPEIGDCQLDFDLQIEGVDMGFSFTGGKSVNMFISEMKSKCIHLDATARHELGKWGCSPREVQTFRKLIERVMLFISN